MLAGIYYGAQYGDSVSAITMRFPPRELDRGVH